MNIFFNELKPYYNIIDIRDNDSYNKGHAYNAINIPYERLLNNPSFYLNKEDKYYIYCKSGIRSKRACELLRLLNYNVVNVIDGYGK